MIFSGVVRSKFVFLGDAAATANSIRSSEWLFRLDFVSDLISSVLFLLAAWALYVLLRPVDRNLALLFLLLNLGGVAIAGANMLNQMAALLLLSGADYLQAFPAEQRQALAMLFVDLHKNGSVLSQLFFGTWLFPLGYLVLKSGFLPRILGLLLLIDGVGEMIWFTQFFLFPGYDVVTYPGWVAGFIAEFSLSLWLLIKGAEDRKPVALEAS